MGGQRERRAAGAAQAAECELSRESILIPLASLRVCVWILGGVVSKGSGTSKVIFM